MTLLKHSLTALRAFEATARYLSFTKAADELFLTRSAVSQQISKFEHEIDVRLFHRINNKLLLSREGEILLGAVRRLLLELEDTLDTIRSGDVSGKLVIGSLPTFGAKWLSTRIRDFTDQYPNLDVTLLSYVSLDDVLEEGVDIAISFAREKQGDIVQEILLQDELWPVCAPSLLQGNAPIKSASDFELYPILHTTLEGLDFGANWDEWAASANLPRIGGRRSLAFSRGYMMLEAVAKGQGIGIAMRTLVETDVAEGRLLRLLDHRCRANKLLALFYLEAAQNRPAVRSFRNWLRERLQLERTGACQGELP
ncbi:LysR substrate-binding domain-containing protein [Defluviimonas sp. SAOS-178_SWC]|uniref:LysR substrate-binding domain-containing protein n=1 Tax=Defluviimonas sp. SAOS-178_SWC TaxID=3121287 RepID=UPI003221E71D